MSMALGLGVAVLAGAAAGGMAWAWRQERAARQVLLESLPVALQRVARNGRPSFQSAGLTQLLGRLDVALPEAVAERFVAERFLGEDAALRARLEALSDRAAARKDGFLDLPLSLSSADVSDSAGETCYRLTAVPQPGGAVLWILEDRSAEQRLDALLAAEDQAADSARREADQRQASFFDCAPVGIALLDADGRLASTNAAFQQLFTIDGEAAEGTPLINLLRSEDRPGLEALLDDPRPEHQRGKALEVRPAGAVETVCTVFASRLQDADGEAGEADSQGFVLHFIETTDQKNLEIQFAQSQKMQAVGQLAGGIAHDFNNLLTAMIGFCDLLLLRHRPGDQSFADLMQIKQNANRAANLVRQLLAFSRQQTLRPRVLQVTDVLVELSHLLRRLIGENIELDITHGRDLAPIKVDQGQLEQVIINLAVNARDAMAEGGGRLSVRTSNAQLDRPRYLSGETVPRGHYVLVEIEDTGCGIPQDNLARIFEPFFSTKAPGAGTGLGLSTVYGIVKQTGGFLQVESTVGHGTTFSIYLPAFLDEAGEDAQEEDDEPPITRDLTGAGTLLLVEDEDAVRAFSARALRKKGYTVLEARSGEMALEILAKQEEPIDLLITDVVMPQVDGPTLVRCVRESRPEMKVIFISGYTEDSFRKHLDQDRGIHFLSKPFSLKQLAGVVKEVLDRAAN